MISLDELTQVVSQQMENQHRVNNSVANNLEGLLVISKEQSIQIQSLKRELDSLNTTLKGISNDN